MTDGINDDREEARGMERRLHEVSLERNQLALRLVALSEERDALRLSVQGAEGKIKDLQERLEASEAVAKRRLETIGRQRDELEATRSAHADAIQVAIEETEARMLRGFDLTGCTASLACPHSKLRQGERKCPHGDVRCGFVGPLGPEYCPRCEVSRRPAEPHPADCGCIQCADKKALSMYRAEPRKGGDAE